MDLSVSRASDDTQSISVATVVMCSKKEAKPGKSSASAGVMRAWLSRSASSKRSTDEMSSSSTELSADKKPKIE